jgi:hypothetical protein
MKKIFDIVTFTPNADLGQPMSKAKYKLTQLGYSKKERKTILWWESDHIHKLLARGHDASLHIVDDGVYGNPCVSTTSKHIPPKALMDCIRGFGGRRMSPGDVILLRRTKQQKGRIRRPNQK